MGRFRSIRKPAIQNEYIRRVEKKDGQLYNVEFATFEAVKDPVKAAEKQQH